MVTEEQIRQALRSVYDPEVNINVQDLGLIYEVRVNGSHVFIRHTLTSMMCPYADDICEDIVHTVTSVPGVESLERELVWDPPFSMEMVPEETRMLMGWY